MPHHKHHHDKKRRGRPRASSAESNEKPKKVSPEDLTRWLLPRVPVPTQSAKGWQKGNKLGHKFKKGEPSNPAGSARAVEKGQKTHNGHLISHELQKLLGEAIPGDSDGRTVAKAIAEVIASKALLGFPEFIKIFLDRSEGRTPITIDVGNTADPLMDLITEMRKKHTELGPAERSESEEAGAKHRSKESKEKG